MATPLPPRRFRRFLARILGNATRAPRRWGASMMGRIHGPLSDQMRAKDLIGKPFVPHPNPTMQTWPGLPGQPARRVKVGGSWDACAVQRIQCIRGSCLDRGLA